MDPTQVEAISAQTSNSTSWVLVKNTFPFGEFRYFNQV